MKECIPPSIQVNVCSDCSHCHRFSSFLRLLFLSSPPLCCVALLSLSSLSVSSLGHHFSITLNHKTSPLPGSLNMCHDFDVAASFTAIYPLCCFGISVTLLLKCLMVEKWLSVENYCSCSATCAAWSAKHTNLSFLFIKTHQEAVLLYERD